jgi:hypothetical protein
MVASADARPGLKEFQSGETPHTQKLSSATKFVAVTKLNRMIERNRLLGLVKILPIVLRIPLLGFENKRVTRRLRSQRFSATSY